MAGRQFCRVTLITVLWWLGEKGFSQLVSQLLTDWIANDELPPIRQINYFLYKLDLASVSSEPQKRDWNQQHQFSLVYFLLGVFIAQGLDDFRWGKEEFLMFVIFYSFNESWNKGWYILGSFSLRHLYLLLFEGGGGGGGRVERMNMRENELWRRE